MTPEWRYWCLDKKLLRRSSNQLQKIENGINFFFCKVIESWKFYQRSLVFLEFYVRCIIYFSVWNNANGLFKTYCNTLNFVCIVTTNYKQILWLIKPLGFIPQHLVGVELQSSKQYHLCSISYQNLSQFHSY